MARASELVALAQSWVGKKESDGSHKVIVDIYNSHKPLPRGYKVKYTDSWCATTITALAIKCNATDIIPKECGCQKMIDLFKKIGCWVENDAYVPKMGDIIFYDWQDKGVGDNVGWSDHVGIVEKVVGNTIHLIEGNRGDMVKRTTIKVNGKTIRGYGVPKYEAEQQPKPQPQTVKPTATKVAKDAAKSFDKTVAGTYKVTASALNVRTGAGTGKAIMIAIPKGTKVKCYGYYTTVLGRKWLYIQFTYNNVTYTGFASSKYLVK